MKQIRRRLGMAKLTEESGWTSTGSDRAPKYTLEDLLALSDYTGIRTDEDEVWLTLPPVGREIL